MTITLIAAVCIIAALGWAIAAQRAEIDRLKRKPGTLFTATCSTLTTRTEALQSIAEQETPGANATVRRMADMAREALK